MMGSCKLVYTVVYGHDMCHGASCVSTASNRHWKEEWVDWIVTSQFNDFDSPLHKSHSLLCQSTYCSTEERERGGGKASSRCQRRNSPIFTIEETHTLISRLTYNHFQWRVHLSYGVGLEEERDWKWNLNSREDSQVPCPPVSPSSLCGPPDRELDRCTSGFRFWEGVGAKQHNETLQVGSRKLGLRRTIFSPVLHSIQILSLWIQGFLVLSRQP